MSNSHSPLDLNSLSSRVTEVYSDGSCNWRDKTGGVGVYFKHGDKEKYIQAGFLNTTVGRMETLGILIALRNLNKNNSFIKIICDSQYALNLFNKGWLSDWLDSDFRNKKNPDILKLLWEEYNKFKQPELISFQWVKGHTGVEGNEIADLLASEARRQNKSKNKSQKDDHWFSNKLLDQLGL